MKRRRSSRFVFHSFLILSFTSSALAQIVSLSPKRLVFGNQVVGTTSAVKKIVVTNADSATTISIISIKSSADFTETNNCGSSIAALASCTVSIQFAPTSSASVNGAVTLTDNAPGTPHVIGLSGTGEGQVSVSPASVAFGTLAIGGNSTKTVKLTNNTTTAVNNIVFGASGDYTVSPGTTNPCSITLTSKTSCNENVTFAPTATGALNGAALITSTAANSPQVLTLTGAGSGTNTAPITLSPSSLAFGNVLVGSTSVGKTLTLANTSASTLSIALAASGDYLETPSGTLPCGASLGAGASCTVSVTFSPATVGSINGSVSVSYTGTNSPQLATLSGSGLSQVSSSASSMIFSTQLVATTSANQTVKILNHTSASITITSINASGDYGVLTGSQGDCGSSIAANGSCNIRVAFTPTHSGLLLGSVAVTDGGNNSPQIVNLSGLGIAPPKFAYGNGADLISFTADPSTGALTMTGTTFVDPFVIGLDPTARFLYGADTGFNAVDALTVDSTTGLLTLVPGSPFPVGNGPCCVTFDPSGRFVFVTNESDYTISALKINLQTGVPTQVAGSPYTVAASPFALAADPSGRFLYVASLGGSSSNVSAFSINSSTGALTPVAGSPFSAGKGAIFVAVDPGGKFVYVSNFGDATVSAFAINTITGSLTPVKGTPFVTVGGPQVLTVDPSGRFLYVGSSDDFGISGYTINQTSGALTQVKNSPFTGGAGIQTDPAGKFLYSCYLSLVYNIDQSTGVLTLTTEPGPGCDRAFAVSGAVP